ncbi:Acg family FMN-binding oxidoreductase [Streptomonospora nanhaiensis]|uniref:Acg family FMN-binding oxidoreductase n=1 Tax=Streptomonospora nanhaiensis TaxID=1323731 RepID=UPI001C395255|nr:hypothetical protein [Streptomonospora nanhaiensis]MBV2364155.1 hypothetical protein [Streptomonospora nanhaiensis]
MDTRDTGTTRDEAFSAAARAAEHAPSVCNTRPWAISVEAGRIVLGADPERGLDVADPLSRELVLSCGAALYTIRVALRAHGVAPALTVLPDPDLPGRLAEVTAEGRLEPDGAAQAQWAAVTRRRTHRGLFASDVDDVRLVRALLRAAADEGAELRPLTDEPLIRSLAGLVSAAEHLQRHDRERSLELARWVRPPGDRAPEGVHAEDFPDTSDADSLFPGRDYGQGRVRGMLAVRGMATGTVALLTTATDTRAAWLAAGQALQRVLLTAAAAGVAAAFHTQPLEEPSLRAFLAERFCEGAHPQMVMRLGRTAAGAA